MFKDQTINILLTPSAETTRIISSDEYGKHFKIPASDRFSIKSDSLEESIIPFVQDFQLHENRDDGGLQFCCNHLVEIIQIELFEHDQNKDIEIKFNGEHLIKFNTETAKFLVFRTIDENDLFCGFSNTHYKDTPLEHKLTNFSKIENVSVYGLSKHNRATALSYNILRQDPSCGAFGLAYGN